MVNVIAVTDVVEWDPALNRNVPVGSRVASPRELMLVPGSGRMTVAEYRKGVPGQTFITGDWTGSTVNGQWETAHDFRATLKVVDVSYRDALILVDETINRYYTMTPVDFLEMLGSVNVIDREVTGKFCFVDRNGTIGIELVSP